MPAWPGSVTRRQTPVLSMMRQVHFQAHTQTKTSQSPRVPITHVSPDRRRNTRATGCSHGRMLPPHNRVTGALQDGQEPGDVMLSERGQTQEDLRGTVPSVRNIRNGKSAETGNRFQGAGGGAGGCLRRLRLHLGGESSGTKKGRRCRGIVTYFMPLNYTL